MNEAQMLAKLKKDPAFRALQAVYAAMLPLNPEGRRKVVEAIHALLPISEGVKGDRKAK